MKTVDGAHEHFVSCIRWAPPVIKEVHNGEANGVGTPRKGVTEKVEGIRCVIATGSVDLGVRIFAN